MQSNIRISSIWFHLLIVLLWEYKVFVLIEAILYCLNLLCFTFLLGVFPGIIKDKQIFKFKSCKTMYLIAQYIKDGEIRAR